jgi:hypothetical protein
MRTRLLARLVIIGSLGATACDFDATSDSSPQGSIHNDTLVNGLGSPLTSHEAMSLAVDVAQGVAQVAAAITPLKDLQAIFEGGLPPPSCPVLEASVGANNTLNIELQYASGCHSNYFPDTVFVGAVKGVFYAARYEFDVSFEDMSVRSEQLAGTTSGSVQSSGDTTTFLLNLKASKHGTLLHGVTTLTLDCASGTMTFSGDLQVVVGAPLALALRDVRVSTRENAGILPDQGSVLFMDASAMARGPLATVRFHAQTPLSAEAIVEVAK